MLGAIDPCTRRTGAYTAGMVEMTPQRWRVTNEYSLEVFGREDEMLRRLRHEAAAAGLPDIAVGPDVGRFLMILASMTRGRLALELGTLAGYSAVWIARGLAPEGRLITVESDPAHAAFARRQLALAGLGGRVEVREGAAIPVLRALQHELPRGALDLVFIDAEKTEYPEYFRLVRDLVAPGGLIAADNVYGSGSWWIDDREDPNRVAADRFNRAVASDPEFQAVAMPFRQGVLVARRQPAPTV